METQVNFVASNPLPANRHFGIVVGGIFFFLGALPLIKGGEPYYEVMLPGMFLVVVALIYPRLLTPLNKAWFWLGNSLHALVSPIMLALIFFLVLTPLALLRKCLVRDPMNQEINKNCHSYWMEKRPVSAADDSLKKQF